MAHENGFGSYLANVKERDIDLLLMEEFHCNPEFVSWFCQHCGEFSAQFDGAWHSVTSADGETDLLLRVTSEKDRIGILIENKISAPEQALQAERYHLRAAKSQHDGQFERFVVCMCAPRIYFDALPDNPLYQTKIAYEDIAEWFALKDDARSKWRRTIVQEAIAQSRRGYRMVVNETVSAFHQEFWKYIQTQQPHLVMRRPTPKGNKSNWIIFKGLDFPKNVKFHLKMDQQVIELGFAGVLVTDLRSAIPDLPRDIRTVQKGGVAALSIPTPFLDQTKSLSHQQDALARTMEAVGRLLPFARAL